MSETTDYFIDGPEPRRRKPRKGIHCATPGCKRLLSPYAHVRGDVCEWCKRPDPLPILRGGK